MSAPRRPILALAAAETASLMGTRLALIAIPWLVITMTGDPILTGIVGMAEMLPYIIAKLLVGPFVDRLGARRIAIAGDCASAFVILLVPLLHLLGRLDFVLLLPVVVAVGAFRAPADAAKQALVPAVAKASSLPLERVAGLMSTLERLATAIGTAVGGAVVAVLGAAPALVLTGLACALSAAIIAFALPRSADAAAGKAPRAGYLADLREGWVWFRRDAVLVGIVAMVAITNLLDQAYVGVLLPVWAAVFGDAASFGLSLAIFSAGAVLGAGIATLFAERLPRLLVYVVAFVIAGTPRFAVFAIEAEPAVIFAIVCLSGFAGGFLNPILGAVMFERIPPHLTGRVSSLVNALSWSLIPFGGLVGGLLLAAFGLQVTFALCGGAYLLATMLPLARRSFREFADRRTRPVEEATDVSRADALQ